MLGAGVRVVRAAAGAPASAQAQPALEHQAQSADSAARAGRAKTGGRGRGARVDTGLTQAAPPRGSRSWLGPQRGALDREGYVGDKLDLDVATAAQIDSLPGVTPTMAKRIVADRMRRGPFLNADGLCRVSGVGPTFVKRLDSLVTFSGTYRPSVPSDTIIRRVRNTRVKRPPARP